ncbi:MAG: hypothetical protein ACK4PK_09915 [Alphaproteobacteria bacterium]
MFRYKIILAGLLFLTGCATPISPEEIANADYGPPPPAHHQSMIRQEFATLLIDPTSPLYTFEKPAKGYFKESSMYGTQQMFGWKVCGTVNSKNRMGGYNGAVPFVTLFRDGAIAQTVVGKPADMQEAYYLNGAILDVCRR